MKIAHLGKLTFTYEIYQKIHQDFRVLGNVLHFRHEKYLEGEPVSYDSIQDIVDSVRLGHADLGIIPLKNRIVGKINSYDLKDVRIIRKIKLPIKMALGGLGNKEEIRYVISKSEALMQCEKYISSKKLIKLESNNTVSGIEQIVRYRLNDMAVICSENALLANKLRVYEKDISDIKPNYTIFGIICAIRELNPAHDLFPWFKALP